MSDFKLGSRVIITQRIMEHQFNIGEVVELVYSLAEYWLAENELGKRWYINEEEAKLVDSKIMHNSEEPITHKALLSLGYIQHGICKYYCAPSPAHGGTYRLEFRATSFVDREPVKGSEKWRAYLPYEDCPTIRGLKTLGELKEFHKGMCGGVLNIN